MLFRSSPRALVKMTRDATNHPLWNALVAHDGDDGDGQTLGRVGRFAKRFDGMQVRAGDIEGE